MNADANRSYFAADCGTPLAESSVGDLLVLRAAEHPDRLALVGIRHGTTTEARLTYAELLAEASAVAGALARLVAPGSFVALWAPNIVEWPIIQYGAALAGMVLVALNPVLREAELEYALRHSGAAVLLHSDVSGDYAMTEVADRVCADLPELQRISLSDKDRWTGMAPAEPAPIDPDQIAMLQYTSGTTGRPKGVVLKHRSLVNVARLTIEAVEVPAAAVCMNPLPMFHTAGCVSATLGPLWAGGTVILAERFRPQAVLAGLRREHVRVLFYVPAILKALLKHQRSSADPTPQVDIAMGGASNVDPELIEETADVFGAEVYNLYGQTELAPVLTMTRPGDSMRDRLKTVGRPLPHVDCKVVDPESGEVLPVGMVGEICARGYQQFVEYLHDPDATAEALDREGFVRTGDLGAMDERGYLTVTGRLKELIIRGGENIAPTAVEAALDGFDPAVETVVVGLPDDRLGETVAAVLRVRVDDVTLKDRMIEHARINLAPFMIPSRWFLAAEFPVTPTGKVQRFAVKDAILRGDLREL